MKLKNRLLAAATAIFILNSSSVAFAANFSDPYPLPGLTGDWRTDFVEVAKSQLGYTEASDGSSYFGDWADQTYRPWCSEFAAWCAQQAQIPETVIPIGLSTRDYRDFFAERDRYYYIAEGIDAGSTGFMAKYSKIETIPITDAEIGDIILKETDGNTDNGPDHTGIFLSYSNDEVEYISGNSSDKVEIRRCSPREFHGICKPDFELKDTPSNKDIDEEEEGEEITERNNSGSSRSSGGKKKVESIEIETESSTSQTTEETTAFSSESDQLVETKTEEVVVSCDIKVSIGSNLITVGNEIYSADVSPYIQAESNSTLIPLRFVSLAIISGIDPESAKDETCIKWDPVTKSATIFANDRNVKFTAGSSDMIFNGIAMGMENGVKAEIKDGRLFIPFRALGKALGVDVDWDAETKTAIYKVK